MGTKSIPDCVRDCIMQPVREEPWIGVCGAPWATASMLCAMNSSAIGSTGIRIRQLCDTTVVTCTNVDVINGKSRGANSARRP